MRIGEETINLSLNNSQDKLISLGSFSGKKIVIYFYPKALTSGCTKQALAFKEYYSEFVKMDTIIIGISKDNTKLLNKFQTTLELPFLLLSDESLEVIKMFGVWKEKSMYGKKYFGVERSTFVLNQKHQIVKIFKKVKSAENAKDVLEYLKETTI